MKYYKLVIVIIAINCINSVSALAQFYGLEFKGQGVTQNERTGLNLNPDSYFSFKDEFEISFDFLRSSKSSLAYGYIFRVISQDNLNVDLISTPNPLDKLNVVFGEQKSALSFKMPSDATDDWVNLRIKFLLKKNRIVIYTRDTFYVENNIQLKNENQFKIIFGASYFKKFRSTDVPSMKIKDVKIFEKGKMKYYWPLDEEKDDIAIDRIQKQIAKVKNPVWLEPKHQNWYVEFTKEVKGYAQVAADVNKGKIFVIGKDELLIYSVNGEVLRKVPYVNKPLFLTKGSQAIFNSNENKIYSYLVDEKLYYSLDIDSGEWSATGTESHPKTEYLHHNKYYNAKENAVYIFGGYGHLQYKNKVQKINLTDHSWDIIEMDKIDYFPRYLGGLGHVNDTVYLFGGYGSHSGDQMINPQNYYDLLSYSGDENRIKRKFKVPIIIADMCIANTMWIDDAERFYYALAYKKNRYNGSLQLIKGDLDQPDVSFVGSKISYQFLDVESYADLFYFPNEKKLVSYTSLYTDSVTTLVNLHSINYPPNNAVLEKKSKAQSDNMLNFVFFGLGIMGLGIFIYFYRKKKKENTHKPIVENTAVEKYESSKLVAEDDLSQDLTILKYQFVFFGGFQVFDKEDRDITNKFSPLLKELFLLIWFNTKKNAKGISSEKIREHLWFDKSDKSAQNNRAVNVAKLRTILNEIGDWELSNKTGYWKVVNHESDDRSDYVDFLQYTNSKTKLSSEKMNRLINTIEKGAFLVNVNYEWLDDYKADVSDRIINTLVEFVKECNVKKEAGFIIKLSDCIFTFDPVNEDAMIAKCRAQRTLGKHSLAKATYNKFTKEYSLLYDIEYTNTFGSIINS